MPAVDLGTPQLLLDLAPPLAWLTFNRPEARNAMTWAMYDGLVRGCEAVDATEDVRVLLLAGAGQSFVAGTDISQFREFETGHDALAYEARMEAVLNRLETVHAATIAVLRGYAVGAGAAIALACDLRVCGTDVQFGVPVARTLGNTLNLGNYRRLVAMLGTSRTRALLLTGRLMGAAEARECGLANEVAEPEQVEERARAVAGVVAGNAPLTVQAAKEALRRLVHEERPTDDDLIVKTYTSDDFREGVAAFFEKRRPEWKGR